MSLQEIYALALFTFLVIFRIRNIESIALTLNPFEFIIF